jgi:hypothetical protein
VSATLAARDAEAAARAGGSAASTQAAAASFGRVLALAPAFGPVETARLMRPWRDLDARDARDARAARNAAGSGPRRVDHPG